MVWICLLQQQRKVTALTSPMAPLRCSELTPTSQHMVAGVLVLLVCGAQAAGTEEAVLELRAVVASLRSKVAELEMNQQAAGVMLVQQMHSTKVRRRS